MLPLLDAQMLEQPLEQPLELLITVLFCSTPNIYIYHSSKAQIQFKYIKQKTAGVAISETGSEITE